MAREIGADLVVIGAHGGHERPWARLGTTAERPLRAAESSVRVVRGNRSSNRNASSSRNGHG
jgi:nucleotide-binding universal stress UspA family protein